jgi:hypothetical protein
MSISSILMQALWSFFVVEGIDGEIRHLDSSRFKASIHPREPAGRDLVRFDRSKEMIPQILMNRCSSSLCDS